MEKRRGGEEKVGEDGEERLQSKDEKGQIIIIIVPTSR